MNSAITSHAPDTTAIEKQAVAQLAFGEAGT